jgi:mono/diheme cytochrome c family protein
MALTRFVIGGALLVVLAMACGNGSPSVSATMDGHAPTGMELFALHCTLCHGKDGKLGINGAKDLSVSSLSRDEMIALVTEGKGAMMPYKNVLTKKQVELVVDHVRTLRTAE